MSKKTLALIILLFIMVFGLLYILLSPKTKNVSFTPPPIPPTPTPAAKTVLSFLPSPLVIASRSANANIVVDSQGQELTAVQFEIAYDPKLITVLDVTPGVFFDSPIVLYRNIDAKVGKLSYMLAIPPTSKAKSGTGTVAVISFSTGLSSGENTEFTFLPKTMATAKNVYQSVLQKAEGAKIFYLKQATSSEEPLIGPVKPATQ